MSQESHNKPPDNTRTGGNNYQAYRWIATWKAEERQISQVWTLLNEIAKEFYFQLEKGEKSDYLHYQICFSLKTKEYMKTVKNHFANDIHLETVKDWFAAIKYCTKEDTRIQGYWSHEKSPIWTITTLNTWQKELHDILLKPCEPNDRKIYWYWENKGNVGKSAFTKYMAVHHQAIVLSNAATKDIAEVLRDFKEIKMVIIDLPRTSENYLNYGAIEQIKNGMILASKYHSKQLLFNTPHVVIFSNFEPDKTAMSSDRWTIKEL